ncbi:MAG: glycosyltransferase family 2 protein, partial [Chloroflexi bacterium]
SRQKLKDYLRKISQNDKRVHLFENQRNMGPGYANRLGFAEASHQLICLMDSDVLVPPGWLDRLVADFQQNPELKMIAPLQPSEQMIHPFDQSGRDSKVSWNAVKQNNPDLPPHEQFLIYSNGLSIDAFEAEVLKVNPPQVQVIEAPPDFLSSCCLLLDRRAIEKAGGIADPDFRAYGSEDVDLCWRIAQEGKIAKTSSVYVHHFQGVSLQSNQLDRASALQLANQILYDKWKDKLLKQIEEKIEVERVELIEYLESHFIYSALARSTSFIDDLRKRLNRPDIPEDIVWFS